MDWEGTLEKKESDSSLVWGVRFRKTLNFSTGGNLLQTHSIPIISHAFQAFSHSDPSEEEEEEGRGWESSCTLLLSTWSPGGGELLTTEVERTLIGGGATRMVWKLFRAASETC